MEAHVTILDSDDINRYFHISPSYCYDNKQQKQCT